MEQKPRAVGARAPDVQLGGEPVNPTPKPPAPQPARLLRRLLRKITVEPTGDGWRARIVGSMSRTFSTRHMAIEAAKAASRQCGLPVIVLETLTPPDGPMAA